jgi:hypothetical protein
MKRLPILLASCTIIAMLVAHTSLLYSQSQGRKTQAHAKSSSYKVDTLVYFTSSEVEKSLMANLDKAMKANASANSAVANLGMSVDKGPYLAVARTAPGLVEVHELWDDVAIIRSGHGTLKTGLVVTGDKKETNAEPEREWRGGAIENAEVRNLAPGDFVIIPAMLAHQYIPTTGETLTYWTVKVKRPRGK